MSQPPSSAREIPIQFEQSAPHTEQTSYGWKVNDAPAERASEGKDQSQNHAPIPLPDAPHPAEQPQQKPASQPVSQNATSYEAKAQLNHEQNSSAENGGGLKPPDTGAARPQRAASPMHPNMTPLEQVTLILSEATEIQERVNAFKGRKGDKEYLYLEEMLTRKLLKLDNILSEGNEEIRSVRKQAVRTVQSSLDQLELKAFANDQPEPASNQLVPADTNNSNSHNNNHNSAAVDEDDATSQPQCARDDRMQTDSGVDSDSRDSELCSSRVRELVLDSEVKC